MKPFSIEMRPGIHFQKEDVLKLYKEVGWIEYIKHSNDFWEGVQQSLYVLGLYNQNKLIGFCRVVGDGKTVILIQDLIIEEYYRYSGYGSLMLTEVYTHFKNVRQKIVVCDNEPRLVDFYRKNGFKTIQELDLATLLHP